MTFYKTVDIVGDGVEKPLVMDREIRYNYKAILANGLTEAETRMKKPICETKESLLHRVREMKPQKGTCLGPAVLTSVAMASKGAPGSQVIVLTDGEANTGLGLFKRDNP